MKLDLRLDDHREIQLRFEAWLEQRYHLTVHEATGQAPLDRFAQADFTPRYPDPVLVAETFRVRGRRKVHPKTVTVEVEGIVHPLPAGRPVAILQRFTISSATTMTTLSTDQGPELPPPTAPDNIPVTLRAFPDRTHAEEVGRRVADTVRTVSRWIDVSRLDGITVAYDYDDALAQLDRGYTPSRPLGRTSDDHVVGVAMAPAVLRSGMVKGHIVVFAPAVLPLQHADASEAFRLAVYLVAHECAHIADLKHRDECFPDTILQRQVADHEESLLEPVVSGTWNEYAACRASALFGEAQAAAYEEALTSALPEARPRANEAIRSYRSHADIERVLHEAGSPLCQPLRLAAYLAGHIDGLGTTLDDVPRARDALARSPYAAFVHPLWEVLRDLWSRRGQWTSLAEFDPIKQIAREVFANGGMILHRRPDGALYVDIPFTPDTMP